MIQIITITPMYEDFINGLSDGLLRELGDSYETRAITNTRNNGIAKRGILIRHQQDQVAPAIYLDDYFREYCEGRCLSDIVRQVLYTYEEGTKENGHPKLGQFELTPEAIREKLVFRIVNYAKNAEELTGLPHIRFLNLAVTFQILVYQKGDGIGTIRFNEKHYESLGSIEDSLTLEKLYQIALANTSRLFPPKLTTIEEILGKLTSDIAPLEQPLPDKTAETEPGQSLPTEEKITESGALLPNKIKAADSESSFPDEANQELPLPDETNHKLMFPDKTKITNSEVTDHPDGNLYVLTNAGGINGAGCLLYPGLLEQLKDYFQSEYYILPSSIHEVLLFPARHPVSQEELDDMVREVNLTQVPEEEILSDYCYFSSDIQKTLQNLFFHENK